MLNKIQIGLLKLGDLTQHQGGDKYTLTLDYVDHQYLVFIGYPAYGQGGCSSITFPPPHSCKLVHPTYLLILRRVKYPLTGGRRSQALTITSSKFKHDGWVGRKAKTNSILLYKISYDSYQKYSPLRTTNLRLTKKLISFNN